MTRSKVSNLRPMTIGANVEEIIVGDQKAEQDVVKAYSAGITLASEVADEAAADLLVTILKMEEGHVDWTEKQRTQIKQMGVENYLANQAGGEE